MWPICSKQTQSPKHSWSFARPFHTIGPPSPPPDTRRGSIAPIQPCIVSLQVPTTEIRCRWDRCLLTQPLHDNEATAPGRNLQRSVSGYGARWAGRGAAPLIPFLLTDSRGPTDGSPRVNRLQDQVQIGSYSFGYVWDLITSRYPRLRNVFPALCLLKKCWTLARWDCSLTSVNKRHAKEHSRGSARFITSDLCEFLLFVFKKASEKNVRLRPHWCRDCLQPVPEKAYRVSIQTQWSIHVPVETGSRKHYEQSLLLWTYPLTSVWTFRTYVSATRTRNKSMHCRRGTETWTEFLVKTSIMCFSIIGFSQPF